MSKTWEHTTTIRLAAPPARVFAALTDAGELRRWFAEEAEVEARAGGAYRFWGKATLGAPGRAEATQVVTACEDGARLAFRWTVLGAPSEVTYTLAADAQTDEQTGGRLDGTALTVRHVVEGALGFRRDDHALDDLWRLHGGNLRDHVAGVPAALPDFASPAPAVRVSTEIAAPPAQVFRALVEPALLDRWTGGAARVDLARGALSYGWQYELEGRPVAGGPTRILERVDGERLVTDWPDWRGDPDKPVTRVAWTLAPLDGGGRTRVTLVHDGFEHAVDRGDYQQGWAGFLQTLGIIVTTR